MTRWSPGDGAEAKEDLILTFRCSYGKFEYVNKDFLLNYSKTFVIEVFKSKLLSLQEDECVKPSWHTDLEMGCEI